MIIFNNYRENFYADIRKDHVLIIANVDADAVCATQILLDLFSADDIAYTLVPVNGWQGFEAAMAEHGEQAHSIVLFNCGATKSLNKFIRRNVTCYVIDSRRPLDLDNVFNYDRIRLIVSDDERKSLNIPSRTELDTDSSLSLSEDSESDEESESDNGNGGEESRPVESTEEGGGSQGTTSEQMEIPRSDGNDEDQLPGDSSGRSGGTAEQAGRTGTSRKRMREIARTVAKREAKRRRKEEKRKHRDDVLWDYYENSWYAPSSAVLMLEVAQSVGRTTVEMMWSAVVGISSQLVEYLISHSCYTAVCFDRLRPFIRKFIQEGSDLVRGDDILRLNFEKEIMLPLYAHWSIYSSMINNDFFFCQTHMWQQSGILVMKALLAELEITLEESHQIYSALTTERKKAIFHRIDMEMDDNFASFTAHIGYSSKYSSCDFGRAIAGRMSYGIVEVESPYDRFLGGQEILQKFMEDGGDMAPISKAIESYKNCLSTLVNLVFTSISQSLIASTGPFYLLCLPQEDEARVLHSRHFLYIFAHYTLRAFNAASRSKNRVNRPLFVAVPLCGENAGWFLITGIMPLNTDYEDHNQKSFIGRAMGKVIENYIREGARQDFFDPGMVMIRSDQKARFFDGLQASLEIE